MLEGDHFNRQATKNKPETQSPSLRSEAEQNADRVGYVERGRTEVASFINRVPVPPCSCVVQAIIAGTALRAIGLPSVRIGLGGLLYRCGPKVTDLMTYCDERGFGVHRPNGKAGGTPTLFGHAFVLSGPSTLIDLTLSDLRHDLDHLQRIDPEGHTQTWTVDPPSYYWGCSKSVRRNGRLIHPPEIGEFIITDYIGDTPPWNYIRSDERDYIRYTLGEIAPDIENLKRRYELGELIL
jgi:hypothetical protein